MTIARTPIPDNIGHLHTGEEMVREKSIAAIEADSSLSIHLDTIKRTMDLFDFFICQHKAKDDDESTFQLLGIRAFNGFGAALRLLLGGYYQASALQQRDILETVFLLDLLKGNRSIIAEWRKADKKTRIKKFRPAQVREALDRRDGHTGKKRGAMYDMFCELAGHATPNGFTMLSPRGMGAHCGPFFDSSVLEAVVSELGRLAVQAGEMFSPFFPIDTQAAVEVKLRYLEGQGNWVETFYEKPFDRSGIDELRALLKATARNTSIRPRRQP